MENLSNVLRRELGAQSVKTIGGGGGGCISQGQGYQVDAAKVFVKMNDKKGVSILQDANLRGFRASMNPRFEGGIPDLMDGIPDFMDNFNTL